MRGTLMTKNGAGGKIAPVLFIVSVMAIIRMTLMPNNTQYAYAFALIASMAIYWIVTRVWKLVHRGRAWLLLVISMTLSTTMVGMLIEQAFLGFVLGGGVALVMASLVLGMLSDHSSAQEISD